MCVHTAVAICQCAIVCEVVQLTAVVAVLSPAFDRDACGAFKLHFSSASVSMSSPCARCFAIVVAIHMRFVASFIFQQYFLLLLNTALLGLIFALCVCDFRPRTALVPPSQLLATAVRSLLLPLHFVFSYCASIFHPICIWVFVVVQKVLPNCAAEDNILTFRFIMVSSLSERWHKFWANDLFWFVFLPL